MTQLPSELLDQAGNLTDMQSRIIRAHPKMGAELLTTSAGANADILGVIQNHHERVDGSGYPQGSKGDAIPMLARIAGLVDTYDAMITARPYAKARTSHEATQELLDCSGIQFEPALVEHFVKAIGLFPTGTMIELNTGEVALVVAQNATRRLKPQLMIVLDRTKKRLETPRVIDLAKQAVAAEGERWIARELAANSHGICCEEFFI
jgi:HD-GYP domain-containing protein (c-di-GMP phosphodiesterase class II)